MINLKKFVTELSKFILFKIFNPRLIKEKTKFK